MKTESKLRIPFSGGINTLVNPKSIKEGMVPFVQNFFPYEIGSLEKRKGAKYLRRDANKWYLSSSKMSVKTIGTSGNTKAPYSNIGVKNILAMHYYNPNGEDLLFCVVDTFPIGAFDITNFGAYAGSYPAIAGSTGFVPNTAYTFGFFAKSASGLEYLSGGDITVTMPNDGSHHAATFTVYDCANIPYCQYGVIGLKDGFGQYSPVGVFVPGSTSVTIDKRATMTYDQREGSKIYLTKTLTTGGGAYTGSSLFGTFDTCQHNGACAIYVYDKNKTNEILTQQFITSSPRVSGLNLEMMCSCMPFSSLVNANDSIFTTECDSIQYNYNFCEAYGHLYLPTINARSGLDNGQTNPLGWGSGTGTSDEPIAYDNIIGVLFRYGDPLDTTTMGTSKALILVGKTGDTAGQFGPPRAKDMTIYLDRAILVGNPFKPNKIYHSDTLAASALGAKNFYGSNQTILSMPEQDEADIITAVHTYTRTSAASGLEQQLLITRNNSLHMLSGNWDDTTPTNNSVSHNVLSMKIGCPSKQCIMHSQWGVVFIGNEDIYVVNPSGDPVPIGAAARDLLRDSLIRSNPIKSENSFYTNFLTATSSLETGFLSSLRRITIHQDILRCVYDVKTYPGGLFEGSGVGDQMIYEIWIDMRNEEAKTFWLTKRHHPMEVLAGVDNQYSEGRPVQAMFNTKTMKVYDSSTATTFEIGVLLGANGYNPIVMDTGYNDLGNPIRAELIGPELDFGYPALYKLFTHIGITAETDYSTVLYGQVVTSDGLDDLDVLRTNRLTPTGIFDVSKYDESYWNGRIYDHKKLPLSLRPIGKSGRVIILHSEADKNIRIIDLELFFKIKKRSML